MTVKAYQLQNTDLSTINQTVTPDKLEEFGSETVYSIVHMSCNRILLIKPALQIYRLF